MIIFDPVIIHNTLRIIHTEDISIEDFIRSIKTKVDLSKIDKCLIYAETANYTEDCTRMIRIDKIIPKLKKIVVLVNSDVTPIKTLFGIKVFSAFHLRSPIKYCSQEEDAVKWLNYSRLNNLKLFLKKLFPINSL